MLIRHAEGKDSEYIWMWRNDEQTRAMSIIQDEVDWEVHVDWYADQLSSNNKCIYVGVDEETGERVGMVHFNIRDREAEISINLNPTWRGKKISADFLELAINQFRKNHKIPLMATIRIENPASIKCFEKCGFRLAGQDVGYKYFKLR